MGLFVEEYRKYWSVPDLRSSPDGRSATPPSAAAPRPPRPHSDVMMAARSTPNLLPPPPAPASVPGTRPDPHPHHHHHHHHPPSIYSYLQTQSGLNFAPVVHHRDGSFTAAAPEGGGTTSTGTASPPPAPPVRDASSLKGVKYGPGHEKFPSWPVSAAAEAPANARPSPGGGSHRSKSWTDHTNYPKEKGITYTRPYMKRPNPAFTQQLKTVMERCEKIPPETFEGRSAATETLDEAAVRGALYLPRVDREGKALGDDDYLVPSPPERDLEEELKAAAAAGSAGGGGSGGSGGGGGGGAPLTQADLEAYARAYQPPQPPSSYAQSEGYHSYVSSSDSSTTTPFLDRLRRDCSELASEGRPVPGPQAPPSASGAASTGSASVWGDDGPERERPGRDSVVTTSSGSASSSETLKWHGSLSDVSVASSSCTQPSATGSGGSRQLIAHSARVQTPQRHLSESVLYLGGCGGGQQSARVQRNNHHNNKLRLFPVHTYTVQPSGQQQQLQQAQQAQVQQQQVQQATGMAPSSESRNSQQQESAQGQSAQAQQQNQAQQQAGRSLPSSPTQPTLSVAERISELERQQQQQQQHQQQPSATLQQHQLQQQTRYTYYDPDKRHRVSDPTLKAIQKKALLSFYERHHQGPPMVTGVPGGSGRAHQTAWRSEPHLAQPSASGACPPQSPPPPQPPPRPRNGGQSSRRASSASDYAGGLWRETVANREQVPSDTNNMRETARHQHSSSCGSLSTDLLGPVIMGPSISVDDWVPERPPKKPHLRTAFAPPLPDRMASPDLPPPSPPPVVEDEVFATDEPLPPPPPELHPSDWNYFTEHPEKTRKQSIESSSDVPRYPDKEGCQSEYTNLPPRVPETTPKPHHDCGQRHERVHEGFVPSHRHQESPRQSENPPSPQRTQSSSYHKHSDSGIVPPSLCEPNHCCNGQNEFDPSNGPMHWKQDSVSKCLKYPEIGSDQMNNDCCSSSSKRLERSSDMSSFVQKYSQNSLKCNESNHHLQRHSDTDFSNHRYLENGSTAHPRILETGHAVHRHLETGATIQRHSESLHRQSENNHNSNHRHSDSNLSQRHMETSFTVQRPVPSRIVESEVSSRQEDSYLQGNNNFVQRHSEKNVPQKFSESFSSARSYQQENFNKLYKHDENMSHSLSHSNNHRHSEITKYDSNCHPQKCCENESPHRNQHCNMYQKNYENGKSSHNSHGPPSPKKENLQKCRENGLSNQGHIENTRQFERYFENGGAPPSNRYTEGGGTLNRRYLESNRSLDGGSAMYRYHENALGHRNSSMYHRPSGMRSTENLHQKCLETPKSMDGWTSQKFSTQKLVVNGKLATPLPDRPMQNGGFTDSMRMSDLDRTNKRNSTSNMSMPARARLQRLPLAVSNGELPPKPQVVSPLSPSHSQSLPPPTGPRSPPHSQMASRSGQGHSPTEHRHMVMPTTQSPPREKMVSCSGPRSPPHSVVGPMMSHIITSSSHIESRNQRLHESNELTGHNEQSTSKASYIAYRRERDRGLPNFEGSYKRTMSPSERSESLVETPASSPVPECDRVSMDRESSASGASLEEPSLVSLHRAMPPPPLPPPRANSLESCSEQSSPNLELARGNGADASPPPSLLVVERLDAVPASVAPMPAPAAASGTGVPASVVLSGLATLDRKKQHRNNLRNQQLQQQQQQASARASPETKKAAPPPPPPPPSPQQLEANKSPSPRSVETETQCDMSTVSDGQRSPRSAKGSTTSPGTRPASPPPPSPTITNGGPKVTECLQLVQRSEVVLRVNAATSDASSQTETEREASPPPLSTPPATAAAVATAPNAAAPAASSASAENGAPSATNATPLLVRPKTQEELDCERLSLDLASQLPPTDKLQTLLVPDPEHKKPTDYVSGLFRLDVALRPRPALAPSLRSSSNANSSTDSNSEQLAAEDSKKEDASSVSPLPANSKYFTISESKAKFLNRYVRDIGQLNGVHDNKDLHQKKEELVSRLDRKLEVLRSERLLVTEESRVNEELGASVAAQVSRLAHPTEAAKYRLHVEEIGKITSLLLALSGRLARAENALMGLPLNHAERKILESKRDKLREQLEEAKKLKENIDRRSISVSNILYKYFNSEEYADYDHFINMKAKLIMDAREIEDKIKLGEEQLAALRETLHTPSD